MLVNFKISYKPAILILPSSLSVLDLHTLRIKYAVTAPVRVLPLLRETVTSFPQRRPAFKPRSGHVTFVVDKVTLGQVFTEYLGFPRQFSFHQLFPFINHPIIEGVYSRYWQRR
jgi:hypothetical protein